MAKKPDKSQLISVNFHEKWLDTPSPFDSLDSEWLEIIIFFVFHVPAEGVSARGKTLDQFGWGKKSKAHDFKQLKDRLMKVANIDETKFVHIDKWIDMKDGLIDNDLEVFPNDVDNPRLTFRKHKSGIGDSLCSHIRNSFAHGRLAFFDKEGEIYVAMEDIDNQKDVTARMILSKTILKRWIIVISEGPYAKKEDVYRKCGIGGYINVPPNS